MILKMESWLSTMLYLFLSWVRASFFRSNTEEEWNSEEKLFFLLRFQNETFLHLRNLIKNCLDIVFLCIAAVSTLYFNEWAEPLGKGFPLPPPRSLASLCKRLCYSITLCASVEWVNAYGWTSKGKATSCSQLVKLLNASFLKFSWIFNWCDFGCKK